MISTHFFFLLAINLLPYSQALQSGYTCDTSVTLACPRGRKLVVLEVTYSSECPTGVDEVNGTSLYPPSRCVGYYREVASKQCNGKETCVIDNNVEQRPAFLADKQANCNFKGKSINIDYACIPDFYSSKLPRVDICSPQSLEDIQEGFIHTPNYPENYPNDLVCVKKVPEPDAGHRLKIYILDFDVESVSVARSTNGLKVNDWLEINDNGEKLYGTREPYSLLFDDVIEATLKFKSNSVNAKRTYSGVLLYFIAAPVRRARPATTTKPTTSTIEIIMLDDELTDVPREKALALSGDRRSNSNVVLVLMVVLLSSILFLIICAFLLYHRRNDRRIRYLTDTFSSFIPKGLKSATADSSEPSDDSNIKFDLSSSSSDNKFTAKHTHINFRDDDHIYSQDPLERGNSSQSNGQNALIYDYIDDDAIYQQVVKPNQNRV